MGGAEKGGGLGLAWPEAVSGRDWLGGRGRAGQVPLKSVGGRLSVPVSSCCGEGAAAVIRGLRLTGELG